MRIGPFERLRLRPLSQYLRDSDGAISIEMGIVSSFMALVTLGMIELGYVFMQWNAVQQSARHGARLAAVSDPVDPTLKGLGEMNKIGDALPDYDRVCLGGLNACQGGQFDEEAFNRIFYGSVTSLNCDDPGHVQRGMCDLYSALSPQQVTVRYQHSALSPVGQSGDVVPVITVLIDQVPMNFALLGFILPDSLATLPPVSALAIAEDMKGGQE